MPGLVFSRGRSEQVPYQAGNDTGGNSLFPDRVRGSQLPVVRELPQLRRRKRSKLVVPASIKPAVRHGVTHFYVCTLDASSARARLQGICGRSVTSIPLAPQAQSLAFQHVPVFDFQLSPVAQAEACRCHQIGSGEEKHNQ